MGLLGTNIKGKDVFNVVTSELDKAILTPQEKADKTIEYQERTNSTPSSVARRWVTKFMIIFIASFSVISVILYKVDAAWGLFSKEVLIEFCSNWVITSILAFFFGGYYVKKTLNDRQKVRLEKKKLDLDIKKKQADIEIARENINLERKRDRASKRKR